MSQARHLPVLLKEVLELLQPGRFQGRPSLWLDGTLGLGGHAKALLEAAGEGACLVGVDRDLQAQALARQALASFGTGVHFVHKSFAGLVDEDLQGLPGIDRGFDGILLDLGVSSLQLDEAERGFSFMRPGPLDMRLDPSQGLSAAQWLEKADAGELARVLREYGEERYAHRLARAVLAARDRGELTGTLELARVAERVLGRSKKGESHPATRLFQALRLAVNGELEALDAALPALTRRLAKGGRMAVISFHSLEDRRVKDYFRAESKDCHCPPGLPECRCGHKAWLKDLTQKPRIAGEDELEANPRSRSAKLRVVERLTEAHGTQD